MVHENSKDKCQQCDKTFTNKKYLNSHIRYVHEDRTLVTCEFCEKEYLDNRIADHIKYMHVNKTLVRCEFCDNYFSNNQSLQHHFNTFHPSQLNSDKV